MDSYYPILSGCLSNDEIDKHITHTLVNFYDEGLGIRCVQEEPWVTVAETNEFIIALVMANNKKLAKKIGIEIDEIKFEKYNLCGEIINSENQCLVLKFKDGLDM